jgi:hypothetical protein
LSIGEHQDATTHDQPALGSVEAEQDESGKRVPPAAKWGMAGLLLVYTSLGTYALVSTLGSSAGPGHPEGVTRSVAVALGKSAAPSRAQSPAEPGTPAPGIEDSPGQPGRLANIKPPPGAAAARVTAPARPATPPDEVLMAISATAVGPDGSSDGDHPGLASLVLDRHSAMSWVTHWYATAHFGNLQDGTGLLLDMGRTVTIRQVELALGGSPGLWGADLQIRVGDTPDLAGQAPVAAAEDAGGWVTAKLQAPATGRYVQIWFTKLPLDPQGTFQEHVYGVTVHGSAPRPSRSSASWVNVHATGKASHSGRPRDAHRGGGHGHGGTGNHGSTGNHARDDAYGGGHARDDAYGGGHARDGGHGGGHARDGGHGGGHAHDGGHGSAGHGAGSSLGIRCRIDRWASARYR